MEQLLRELSRFGNVILIRFVENVMWVTFGEGVSALNAAKSSLQIGAYTLNVVLKSPNWIQQVFRESSVCRDNTTPLCHATGDEVQDVNFDSLSVCECAAPSEASVFAIPPNLQSPLKPSAFFADAELRSSASPTQFGGLLRIASNGPPPVPRRMAPPVPPRIAAPPVPSRRFGWEKCD